MSNKKNQVMLGVAGACIVLAALAYVVLSRSSAPKFTEEQIRQQQELAKGVDESEPKNAREPGSARMRKGGAEPKK